METNKGKADKISFSISLSSAKLPFLSSLLHSISSLIPLLFASDFFSIGVGQGSEERGEKIPTYEMAFTFSRLGRLWKLTLTLAIFGFSEIPSLWTFHLTPYDAAKASFLTGHFGSLLDLLFILFHWIFLPVFPSWLFLQSTFQLDIFIYYLSSLNRIKILKGKGCLFLFITAFPVQRNAWLTVGIQ